MKELPDCLTKFSMDAFNKIARRPAELYDVILSRMRHGMLVSEREAVFVSYVPPVRCVMTREAIETHLQEGYRMCILREFDKLPQ